MARRVLSLALSLSLALLVACKREQRQPTPSASAAASASAQAAREARFQAELSRAQKLEQAPNPLGPCAEVMKEDGDRQLCAEATKALAAVTALPAEATPEAALPVLADAALALVRLFERARYLSLEQLGRERIEGDGGAKARPNLAPSAAPPVGSAPRSGLAQLHDRRNLKLVEGPLGHLTQSSVQLERDVLRHFAAYLEYGSLEVRKSAFERAKQLSEQHPAWPALDRTLREASVLETEPDLKTQLASLANAGFASKKPAQTTGSK